jgi:shikimate kinase
VPLRIVLLGPMAVGKSTAGRRLAATLGVPFRDSDDDLWASRGITGRELAESDGVDALHRWEAEHLLRNLAPTTGTVVVAAAASVVDDAACRAALDAPFVVWLRAPARVLAQRMEGDVRNHDDHRREMGDAAGDGGGYDAEAAAALDARRVARYAALADLILETVAEGAPRPVDEIVAAIVAALPPRVPDQPGPSP